MPDPYTRIQFRKGTAAEFNSSNPVLASGEPAYALDTNTLKVGDGSSTWMALSAISGASESKSSRSITIASTSYSAWLPAYEVDVLRVTSLAGNTTITGINANYGKKQFLVINADVSNPYTITFDHNNTGASAENRMFCVPSNDIILQYGDAMLATYDQTAQKWIIIKISFTANQIVTKTQAEYDALVSANSIDPNAIYVVT